MSRRCRWLLEKIAAKNPLAAWVFESEKKDGSSAAGLVSKTAWRRALRLARIEHFGSMTCVTRLPRISRWAAVTSMRLRRSWATRIRR